MKRKIKTWGISKIAVFLALLMAVPFVSAGTRENPEVSDPSGDASVPLPQYDILNAWIDSETIDSFNVSIEFADLNDGKEPIWGVASYQIDYQLALQNKQGSFYIIDFRVPTNITVLSCNETLKINFPVVCEFSLWSNDGVTVGGENTYLNGSIDTERNVISAVVPKKLLTDYKVSLKKYEIMVYSVLSDVCLGAIKSTYMPWNGTAYDGGTQTLQLPDVAFGNEDVSKYSFQIWPEMDGNSTNESNNATIKNTSIEPQKQKIVPGFESIAVICIACAAVLIRIKFRN